MAAKLIASNFGGSFERPVPTAPDAEIAILGSLLIDRDAVIKVATSLKAGDFYDERHGVIYETVLDLYTRREPGDFVTLNSELKRNGKLDFVGGPAYLTSLAVSTPSATHIEYYAGIVADRAARRRLISVGGQIAGLGYREDMELDDVRLEAEGLLRLASAEDGGSDFVSIRDMMNEYFDVLEDVHHNGPGATGGLPTGFAGLDWELAGLQPGEMTIVAGITQVGKSALALTIARNLLRMGKSVAYISLEMGRRQIAQRLIAMETGITTSDQRRGTIGDASWPMLTEAFGIIPQWKLTVSDKPALTTAEMHRRLERLMLTDDPPDIVFVDHLGLMTGTKKAQNRTNEVGEFSRAGKLLAMSIGRPVVMMAQLNRAVRHTEGRLPRLEHLRDSGDVEQDSDNVIFVHRESVYADWKPKTDIDAKTNPNGYLREFERQRRQALLILAKNRNGESNINLDISWNPRTMSYSDVEEGEAVVI